MPWVFYNVKRARAPSVSGSVPTDYVYLFINQSFLRCSTLTADADTFLLTKRFLPPFQRFSYPQWKMEQFEQLLTCCVCLDRYRNPKLLPCQHSFCMEPCMDGLIDYVKRQVSVLTISSVHSVRLQGAEDCGRNRPMYSEFPPLHGANEWHLYVRLHFALNTGYWVLYWPYIMEK